MIILVQLAPITCSAPLSNLKGAYTNSEAYSQPCIQTYFYSSIGITAPFPASLTHALTCASYPNIPFPPVAHAPFLPSFAPSPTHHPTNPLPPPQPPPTHHSPLLHPPPPPRSLRALSRHTPSLTSTSGMRAHHQYCLGARQGS